MPCCSCHKLDKSGLPLCTPGSWGVTCLLQLRLEEMKPALARLHMPHSTALTAMHVGLGAVRAGECNLRIRGFSAGSYTGAVLAIALHERQRCPSCTVDFFPIEARLGGIAMPRAILRYILQSELRHAVSFVHHQGDQLCIFRPNVEARMKAIREGTRLYFLSAVDGLGTGGHSYGHFLDCEELFRLTPGDYRYSELTKRIGGLADPYVEKAVRSSLMGVACASIQLKERSKAFVHSMLGRQVVRADMEQFLQVQPPSKPSMMELRKACSDALLGELKPHMTDLPQPTMKLVLDMWLPGLALERLIDALGYQFLAMASEAEVEEEPSEQFHYPQKAAVKEQPGQYKSNLAPTRGP